MGLVAARHVGSSQTRAESYVPCTGRRILNHSSTRESQKLCFNSREEEIVFFFCWMYSFHWPTAASGLWLWQCSEESSNMAFQKMTFKVVCQTGLLLFKFNDFGCLQHRFKLFKYIDIKFSRQEGHYCLWSIYYCQYCASYIVFILIFIQSKTYGEVLVQFYR